MNTTLLSSPLGAFQQKSAERQAQRGMKKVKKYCSVAFEGILWVMTVVALALIVAGGIVNFIPTGLKILNYPIGEYMNMPIGIYALVYTFIMVWPVIPFPFIQRRIPILSLFQRHFAVRGLVMGVLSLGLALTLATAFGCALLLLACVGYVVVQLLGFKPKWVIDEGEQAVYVQVRSTDDVQLESITTAYEINQSEESVEDEDDSNW